MLVKWLFCNTLSKRVTTKYNVFDRTGANEYLNFYINIFLLATMGIVGILKCDHKNLAELG